ncbi:MAG: alpha/beta hydrolase, partial [Bradyrhizobium sp.]
MSISIEPVTGKYLNMPLFGKRHRIYFEEAGQGIPLLCLHTAGSDGRQYRALLNDPRLTRKFRVIVFDMPWHGKSSPPEGWQDADYKLSSDDYIDMIVSISAALELDHPIAMGCSIGGRAVLHLAARYPERFRALIGLQSSAHVEPYYDTSWLDRPDVHAGLASASIVSGLMCPTSAPRDRWETLWHYTQGGLGVFKGDIFFYTVDGDLRTVLSTIDTDRCPLYLLTGEYDYSCSPADTAEVASHVRGAKVTVMERLGHFPMSE